MLIRLSTDGRGYTGDTTALTADATLLTVGAPSIRFIRADAVLPTVDGPLPTADTDAGGGVPPGWPCARLADAPPSVVDAQAAPTADQILPQIAGALTPRGPAWGADEAGDGRGASPVMRRVWSALAAWVADLNATEWTLATQALPSAITYSLPEWEAEFGLPDPCFQGGSGAAARVGAVRARFAALGGASPAYFVCLAASIGYDITIEEPTQFLCDVSEVVEEGLTETWFLVDDGAIDDTPLEGFLLNPDVEDADPLSDEMQWKYWIVHVRAAGETWFRVDEGELDLDPLEGFDIAADLECLLGRYAPQHTRLLFNYSVT
ncbi:hypothetical protein OPKNFCMD_3827 [Methylobacterium crusticola]|uniref:DUF2313 domain-containing protein n=1 Tax=Methylobacterium crusticola TaxID=1697972 RepID=A0ABQ4R097_9HYPH|nr:putative phage tail protein [Methylobacterium crusticola]GJD51076.1 hypothetical protein OPKNFCMD_3827 [Methylobacterium crusticola]